MKSNFPESLKAVLKSEGGYVNDPRDTGGATNFGITQRVYDLFLIAKGLYQKPVKLITPDEVTEIYHKKYWNVALCDSLPSGVDFVVFDYAVNSGPDRARTAYGQNKTIDGICDARLAWLKTLSNWNHFGNGWTARIERVRAVGKALAANPVIDTTALPPASGTTMPPAIETSPTPQIQPKIQPRGLLAWIVELIALLFTRKPK